MTFINDDLVRCCKELEGKWVCNYYPENEIPKHCINKRPILEWVTPAEPTYRPRYPTSDATLEPNVWTTSAPVSRKRSRGF